MQDVLGDVAPYHWTGRFAESGYFIEVSPDEARAGDVIWQPRDDFGDGHVGIYDGTIDDRGRLRGWQMGNSGAAHGAWGEGGWFVGGSEIKFYRLLVCYN